jgi:hypothetical protein
MVGFVAPRYSMHVYPLSVNAVLDGVNLIHGHFGVGGWRK